MAGEAGFSVIADQSFRVAVTFESRKTPATGRCISGVVLGHHAHQNTVTLDRGIVLRHVVEQIGDQNGAVFELPRFRTLHTFFIAADMIDQRHRIADAQGAGTEGVVTQAGRCQ